MLKPPKNIQYINSYFPSSVDHTTKIQKILCSPEESLKLSFLGAAYRRVGETLLYSHST